MSIREILIAENSYPKRTPPWVLRAGVQLGEILEARVSVAIWQVHRRKIANFLADKLVGANRLIAEENQLSQNDTDLLIEEFRDAVPDHMRGEEHVFKNGAMVFPREMCRHARLYDLVIVPHYDDADAISVAADIIFESGRPILLLPEMGRDELALDTIVIGWDGGRACVRAMVDALPLCAIAREVLVVTIVNEKPLDINDTLKPLERYLRRHGIEPKMVEHPACDADAGEALKRYCETRGADMLVMGAYGHSRAREFILGGATDTILTAPGLPVILSH
ncbi:MAG: universal stress protein [Sphingomonadales bacterium]|nr:universal stress protein [Sphingomonadales bacterium]